MLNFKFLLNTLALVGGVLGSLMVASGNVEYGKYGYILFLTSSLTSCMLLRNDKEQRGMLVLNGFYVLVNTFGLLRWFNII